jgi:hypothetical protein
VSAQVKESCLPPDERRHRNAALRFSKAGFAASILYIACIIAAIIAGIIAIQRGAESEGLGIEMWLLGLPWGLLVFRAYTNLVLEFVVAITLNAATVYFIFAWLSMLRRRLR